VFEFGWDVTWRRIAHNHAIVGVVVLVGGHGIIEGFGFPPTWYSMSSSRETNILRFDHT
jgi:hypothetical protein